MTQHHEEAKYDERGFVTTAYASVASNGTLNLHLKNPSDSNTEAFLKNIVITTQFQGNMEIYDGFSTAPNSGTNVSTQNLLMDTAGGTPDTGNLTSNKNVSFTADSTHLKTVIPSGGQGQSQVGGFATGTDPILQPDRELVVEITNTSSASNPGSINIIYREGSAP